MKNYDKNRKRNYLMVFGLLVLSFLIVFGGLISRHIFRRDYPLVFIDANNKLMYITKSDNQKNDITSIDKTSIVYGNKDTKSLLYTNNNSLYLLDTTVGGTGEIIVQNPKDYGFSIDDKYIYYIDSNDQLYIYSDSKNIFISKNVTKVEITRDDTIIFGRKGELVYYNIASSDMQVIDEIYGKVELNGDKKLVLYSKESNNLNNYYVYNVANKTTKLVLSNIIKLYDKDSNYTKFIYTKPSTTKKNISSAIKDDYANSDKTSKINKEIELRNQIRDYLDNYEIIGENVYYLNGDIETLIVSNINKLYYYDIRNQRYSYTAYHYDNNSIDVASYNDIETFYNDIESKKLNTLYYKVSTNEESIAYKNVTSKINVNIRNDDEYYLLVETGDYYDLYYSKISNRQVKIVGQVDSNLISNKFNTDYSAGYLYSNYINEKYYLNLLTDGKIRNISTDINPEYYVVAEGIENLYYIKRKTDTEGDLTLYNGIRNSKVVSDIHSFIYLNNDLIYVTKNYNPSTKTSDLYRLSGSHIDLIYKNIADWYNPNSKEVLDEEEQ